MERDEKLAEVLSDFARTMLTDFSVQRILDSLVERVVEVMPVTGAGATLTSPDGSTFHVAASDGKALEFERLQFDLGEGPCVMVGATGQAVCVADVRQETRFPKFTREALAAGLAAVFALPLLKDDNQLGVLDLYRNVPGELDPVAFRSAELLADVTAAYVLNAQARADLRDSLDRSQQAALHDPLTGLPNRMLLFEFLERALRRSDRTKQVAAVLFCDIDRFKRINDIFGHRVGDELLVAVADRLSGLMRPSDVVARLAGDEFIILSEGLKGLPEARSIAERLIASFETPFHLSVGRVEVSVSIGVAVDGDSTITPGDLINQADRAMYRAKDRGGARWYVLNDRPDEPVFEDHSLFERLLSSTRRGQEG